jgi:hypothetical protein
MGGMTDLTERQRVERAERAKRALEEFVEPAIDHVCATFEKRLKEVCAKEPWASDKIAALANVIRIAEEIGGDIIGLIHDGAEAQSHILKVERYEALTPARRRLVSI